MVKWIVVAGRESSQQSELFPNDIVPSYFIDVEKMPFCCLIVSNHAESSSAMSATSMSGFSAITHVQTSMPAAMADGVETPKGRDTR
jgi:hypothetical protein